MSSMLEQALDDLRGDEGWRPHVYQDSLGYDTVGYGFLIDKRRGDGMPRHVGEYWLRDEVARVHSALSHRLDIYDDLPDATRRALLNMGYQLGINGLLNFRKMIALLRQGDLAGAAREALDSRWARQTPNRARRVAELMRSG